MEVNHPQDSDKFFFDGAIAEVEPYFIVQQDQTSGWVIEGGASANEQREIIIGHDLSNRLLLVCFTERQSVIRIISAPLATKRERRDYEQNTSL